MRFPLHAPLVSVFLGAASLLSAQTPKAAPPVQVTPVIPAKVGDKPVTIEQVYQANCAACHGLKLEGGSGLSLLGPEWKHGDDSESLFQTIKNGLPDTAMPSWAALGDDTIRGLAIYIREQAYAASLVKNPVPTAAPDGRYESEEYPFLIETFAKDLDTPWSMAWLPDGRILVTERSGQLRFISQDGSLSAPIKGTPEVFAKGQGGLFEVAIHPDYEKNGWIYLSYSDPQKVEGKLASMTAIVRGHIRDGAWVDQQMIFQAPVEFYRTGNVHFGGRLVFHDGYLFFGIGERGQGDHAQDVTRPNGKIHRIFDDGRIPKDNPLAGQPKAFPTIWSYGHRNPQGLVRHPLTGELWETEHGPRGGDELNLIKRGVNYGWPLASYGMNYNGTPLTPHTSLPGKEDPVIYWTPSIAACGLDVYVGDRFPKWKNNLFAGGLAKQEVHRLVVQGGKVTHREVIFKNHGRVRDVCMGPDGLVYIVLNGKLNAPDSRIVRLRPVK